MAIEDRKRIRRHFMRAGYPDAYFLHKVAVTRYRKIHLYPRTEYRICPGALETALWGHWDVLTAFRGCVDVLCVLAEVLKEAHNVWRV
jgi:hypothetical protein